jgi:hypothetical protein
MSELGLINRDEEEERQEDNNSSNRYTKFKRPVLHGVTVAVQPLPLDHTMIGVIKREKLLALQMKLYKQQLPLSLHY